MGTSAVSRRSVVEFLGGNGAPEEIRTPDPQIRSLGPCFRIPGYVELVAAASMENLGLVLSGCRISELCRLAPQGQSLLSAIVGSDVFGHAPPEHELGHLPKHAKAVDARHLLHRRRRLHSECAGRFCEKTENRWSYKSKISI
jgi:hypothetical protein